MNLPAMTTATLRAARRRLTAQLDAIAAELRERVDPAVCVCATGFYKCPVHGTTTLEESIANGREHGWPADPQGLRPEPRIR